MDIGVILSILGAITSIIAVIITISNFVLSRKDKSNKDTKGSAYNQGVSDTNFKVIMMKLNKIEEKLESYDKAFKTTAEEVKDELKQYVNDYVQNIMEKHVLRYHEKEDKE